MRFDSCGCAFFLSPTLLQITGFELKRCDTHLDQNNLVDRHIRRLRSIPVLRDVRIVFVPEQGAGHAHTRLQEVAERHARVRVLYQNGGAKAGVYKSPQLDKYYGMQIIAAFDSGLLRFWRDWITDSERNLPTRNSREGLIAELRDQLLRFRFDEKGKLSGKHGGNQDDGAVALMMLVYWSNAVENPQPGNPYARLRDPDYYEYRQGRAQCWYNALARSGAHV